jgi:hypothetical protein
VVPEEEFRFVEHQLFGFDFGEGRYFTGIASLAHNSLLIEMLGPAVHDLVGKGFGDSASDFDFAVILGFLGFEWIAANAPVNPSKFSIIHLLNLKSIDDLVT